MALFCRACMLLALGLLPAFSSRAQPGRVIFERITEADGLPGGAVTAITQDRQGFMWFGTWHGLVRYDGYTFTHFHHDPLDSTSISDYGQVEWLYTDSRGYIWVGLYGGGLNRYDPAADAFTRFRHDLEDPGSIADSEMVNYIHEDRRGSIWIGFANSGLDRYDPETGRFMHYRHAPGDPSSLSDDHVRVIHEDRRGTLWIGTGNPFSAGQETGGLNRYDRKRDAFVRYWHDPEDSNSLLDNGIQTLYEDARGTLWVGTGGNGLHTYDPERDAFVRLMYDPDDPNSPSPSRLRHRPEVNGPVDPFVAVVHEDREGMLWIGSHLNGLDRYDRATGTQTHYEHDPNDPSSLGDNRVWRMYESHDGTLWVGTFGGLFKINPGAGRFRDYRHDPNDPSTVGPYFVSDLHVDRSSDLWVGTNRGGLQKLDRGSGTFTSFPVEYRGSTTNDYSVTHIYDDRSGNLWVGLYKSSGPLEGLGYLDRQSGRVVPAGLSITSVVEEIHEDGEGVLWMGTAEGLYRYDRRVDTLALFRHERPHPYIQPARSDGRAIAEGRDGTLWFGTDAGLFRFKREVNALSFVLEDVRVTALQKTPEGAWWLATLTHGLLLYDPETGVRTSYTTADGLAHNAISGMLEDNQGFLWLSTEEGLSRFDVERRTFHNYDVSGGLPRNNYSRSAAKGRSGELYFGGSGFVTVFPEIMDSSPPLVALTGLTYTDRNQLAGRSAETALTISLAETMRLPYDRNDLTFAYVGLHFAHPAGNRYAYRLEGYEDEWRYVGAQRTATYTNLSPGAYTFRVRTANADGVWSDEPASLGFVILPPWWRTGWAYVLYALLLLTGVVAVDRMQRRRLIRKERERAKVREAELRAEAAQERAAALQQIDEMKSRFFANISHEFRTPLTLILGPVRDALKSGHALVGHELDLIRRNAQRLLRLINQLLDLSKLDAGGMALRAREGDLAAFLRRITLSFTSRAEREGITLSFSAEPEEVRATFDEEQLEKVISNLLSNAFKFTPTGGKIALSVRAYDDRAEVFIRDTGPGIPNEEIPRLFDRFYQVDTSVTRHHEGSGLGLALVKEFVELHGGTISVESQVGFGTTFAIALPFISMPDESLAPLGDEASEEKEDEWSYEAEVGHIEPQGLERRSTADMSSARRAAVLLVEDNADVRTYVRSHLEDLYHVYEARDGIEGLAKAREIRPDLVIADVMMPRMDGFAFTRAIRSDEDLSHIPVVLLTAKADLESRIEGLEEGADDYLLKPFDAEELLARVESLIEIRRLLRERFSGEFLLGPSGIAVPSEDAVFLERVRDVVEARMKQTNFGVDQLAEEVALSRRQLQRRLKKLTNLTAGGYIRMMRLGRAAQLLEQEAGHVSEVAYRVGYKDVDHFSKVFKQIYNVAPSDYGGTDP